MRSSQGSSLGAKDEPKLNFSEVGALLVDHDLGTREAVKSVIHENGFRDIRTGVSLAELRAAIGERPADLLICEAALPDGDACGLVTEIRHHGLGTDPFLPAILMSRDPTPDLLRRVMFSGADAFMAKPVTASQVMGQINQLTKARKPFVVTSDYIGPDRRKDKESDRGGMRITAIEVPNILKIKAMGATDAVQMMELAIEKATAAINLQKLERHALQIGVLVQLILPAYEKGEISGDLARHLERLRHVAEDAGRRLIGTKYGHVSDLCQSLIKVAGSIAADVRNPNPKDLRLLQPLSQAIQGAFAVEGDAAEIARKISATVQEGKARN